MSLIDIGQQQLTLQANLTSSTISPASVRFVYTCALGVQAGFAIERQPTFTLDAVVKNANVLSSSRILRIPASIPADIEPTGFFYASDNTMQSLTTFLSAIKPASFPIRGAVGDVFFEASLAPTEYIAGAVVHVSA